ncbi:MAG: putative lipid II flippase FtsW [Oscillospiraceae bacterium]|nr:putative lipid II flippase FtsW [Oscillospiraceae bacterium]
MQNSNSKNEMFTQNKGKQQRSMPPVSPARQAHLEKMAEIGAALQNREVSVTQENSDNQNFPAKNRNSTDMSGKAFSTRRNAKCVSKRTALSGSHGGAAVASKKIKHKIRYEKLPKIDFPFFIIVIVLLCFGIVMMFSASYAYAFRKFSDSYYYVFKQLTFIGIGLAAMLAFSIMDYRIMLNKFIIKLGAGIAAGLMLYTTFIVKDRWFYIGGISIQPSEILKFVVIVIFAYFVHTRYGRLKELKYGFRPFLLFLMAGCGLTLMQSHLSATIIIFTIGLIMMFIGDCNIKHIIIMLLVFAILLSMGLLGLKAMGHDYFGARISGWQNPEADIRGSTFQTYQSLITIGSGGLFGLGLGNSRQKYSYLPESHNDFIFSIVCEELGFVGAILVILLFILFVLRGFFIALKARDRFGMLLAVGITSHLGIQSLLNIGVVTNSIPNTGISLPFFSYGGSALIMQLAEIGVILNISRRAAID